MPSLITILEFLGLIVLLLIIIGIGARSTLKARAARQANRSARIGVQAPADRSDHIEKRSRT